MPIQLKLSENHLQILGNDPKRTYYPRYELDYDYSVGDTVVEVYFEDNRIARLDTTTLNDAGTPFASLQAIADYLALGTSAIGSSSISGTNTGGSGAMTSTDVAAGIDASTDIDAMKDTLDNISTYSYSTSVSNEEIKDTIIIANSRINNSNTLLQGVVDSVRATDAITVSSQSGVAIDVAAQLLAADAGRAEVFIQNKSETDMLYVRIGTAFATILISHTVPPLANIAFDGIKSQQRITVITQPGKVVDVYYETTDY